MKRRMRSIDHLIIFITITACTFFTSEHSYAITFNTNFTHFQTPPEDSVSDDSTNLRYPFTDTDMETNPYGNSFDSPLYLGNPSNVKTNITFDPTTNNYEYQQQIGNMNYKNPFYMSPDDYRSYNIQESMKNYWRQKYQNNYTPAGEESGNTFSDFISPELNVDIQGFDKIFGSSKIDIKPQGSAQLNFGINISKVENPTLPKNLQNHVTFDFNEKIQMGVDGQIGEKVNLGINYDTEATFDFENKKKLDYTGEEDEIIKKIEVGDVSLPLSGSLITGSHSLFGVKTKLKFGKLTMTNILSRKKGESKTINVQGQAQTKEFNISADEYEANKHFFLAHYFRDNYNKFLSNLPVISSGIKITRIEVWKTNKSKSYENSRNVVGFMDLGETKRNMNSPGVFTQYSNKPYPDDSTNSLYSEMISKGSNIREINQISSTLDNIPNFSIGEDYVKIENAQKLSSSEYSVNNELGYISLDSELETDEALAVAFEYTVNGEVHQVGEFSEDVKAPKTLILKLIKGIGQSTRLPTWRLMMKNVYSIGGYQISDENFEMNVMYHNDKTGSAINYLPEGNIKNKILLEVLRLDDLNSQLNPGSDGYFDFINGVTIDASAGNIIFPVLQPFGRYLEKKIGDERIADKYAYNALYDSTQTRAREIADKNKFYLEGSYQSSSGSEIQLNAMNIPEGSVKVTANGMQLTEGEDYTVDYTLGRVSILNQGLLESGTPIKISLENNSTFNAKQKTMVGTHMNYQFSDNFNIGGTVMNLSEKPLTKKVSFGDEPISNTIWGFNGSYTTKTPFLTRMVDKIPLIDTKAESKVTVTGEFAHLIPGHSDVIKDKGVSYIDDFEGSQTTIGLKTPNSWSIASTPTGQDDLFPAARFRDKKNRYNSAKMTWYNINSDFQRQTSATPDHIDKDDQSGHFVRNVYQTDLFPNKDTESGLPEPIQVLNVSYYPTEKAPYNYDTEGTGVSAGINSDGELKKPESRWGGIMRGLQTNDFESANVEFIEFWMMDPFVYDSTRNGGKLLFNLGNISEDVLKDSRKSFEQGLPTSAKIKKVDTTKWGRVPDVQSLVNSFSNDPEARKYQDVGLDGLHDNAEKQFFQEYLNKIAQMFGEGSLAYQKARNDPSSDNYHFFKGSDYDQNKVPILKRYKEYNGLDGNSPTAEQSDEPYPTSGSLQPDVEDINKDNTLSETENYYQYEVDISPEDMQVGKNYITDVIVDKNERENGEETKVKWYQFKIPVFEPDKKIGNIQGYKSIRFMRMLMKNFEEKTHLRFAKLHLVRGDWRRYNFDLTEGSEALTTPQMEDASFDISAVNIEENGSRSPVNYVLPPTIDRQTDPTNPRMRQLNEQAQVMKVVDLEDGNARAAYKKMNLDVRQYKKLRMFAHAEALKNRTLKDKELSVFIRIGSDYTQNYYEYEVPLNVTPPGLYNDNSRSDREKVWPPENNFNIDFSVLKEIKQKRNNAILRPQSDIRLTTPFTMRDGKNRVKIVGSPSLSNIKTIMIGVRNPKQEDNPFSDDGMAKSGIIWINELRLTNFKEEGGWAANAQARGQLADFASVTLSGNTSKPGFGGIEESVNERQKEEIIRYDMSSNIHLDKFFPQKYGIRIPMYVSYSEAIRNPLYNPLEPDIELKESLSNAPSDKIRDSIKTITQDVTERKSINFTNVRINNPTGEENQTQPRFYSLSNWAVSFAYNEVNAKNFNTKYNRKRRYSGSINYNFNNSPKNYRPFNSVNFFNNPFLRIIKDFNVYFAPSQISFNTNMNRNYQESQKRNINNPDIMINPTFRKDFQWKRNYNIKYKLTNALKLNFSASNVARIDEPDGRVIKEAENFQEKRDTIFNKILDGGRTTNYQHRINANWRLPINKLPLMDWVNANVKYTGNYTWRAGHTKMKDIDLGNTIKNTQNIQLNSRFNVTNLYNKVDFLKQINHEFERKKGGKEPPKEFKNVTYKESEVTLSADQPKTIIHRLGTENLQIEVTNRAGSAINGKLQIIDKNRARFIPESDAEVATIVINGKKEKKENILVKIGKHTVHSLMSLKNINISYSQNNGTMLPGYQPTTSVLGLQNNGRELAPGLPFIMGLQNDNFARKAALNGWLSTDSLLNSAFKTTHTENLNIRATLEPINNLRINLSATRSISDNMQEYWRASNGRYKGPNGELLVDGQNTMHKGNFNISYNTIQTAFWGMDEDYNSKAFNNFKDYRRKIAWRLAERREEPNYDPDKPNIDPETGQEINNGYPYGYSALSQEVLIPSFLAAYSGREPRDVRLSAFPNVPIPNWRVSYKGLSNIEPFKEYLNSININHSYNAIYKVGNYSSNPRYNYDAETTDGLSYVKDELNNMFIPKHQLANVAISEQFSPLIKVDIKWDNSLTTNFEYRKTRNLSLSFSNNQLIEAQSDEIIVGAGYRLSKIPLIINENKLKSDLNLQADFSLKNMKTVIRKIDEETNQLTSGQKNMAIKFTADYVLNERFNLRFYYDQVINRPKVSSAYPSSNTKIGISVRFTLIP